MWHAVLRIRILDRICTGTNQHRKVIENKNFLLFIVVMFDKRRIEIIEDKFSKPNSERYPKRYREISR